MTRRTFFATGAAVLGRTSQILVAADSPWYRRTYRWGQTNITEADALRYDIAWWRNYWKRTQVQGVIINAGGIVAYYPSKYPLHQRALFLGDRDLYGELCKAAHEDGLVVLARMDCSSTAEAFYRAHPDWFTRNTAGEPYRAADRYITCVNSPYYDEYIPDILREIIDRNHPEGFADNSGLGWPATAFAIALTACANSGTRRAWRFRKGMTGTTAPTGNGLSGVTRVASPSGTYSIT
jgi:hypothetical protein